MNATELYNKDGKPTGVFFCEKCRAVNTTEHGANRCCEGYKCHRCRSEIERYYTMCGQCRSAAEAEKEAARFEKAEKLTSWDGWVYLDGGPGRDGFSESVTDFWDNWENEMDDDEPKPKYVWACKANHFVNATVGDITQAMESEAYEDWDPDTLNGLGELQDALNKFNEANKSVCSYAPDYTRAILLNKKLTNRTVENLKP